MGKSIYEKQQETFKLAKHFGIDVDSYADDNDNRISIGGAEMQQLKKDVAKAGSNDYDLRETLAAAADSGKNKAQKILKDGWSHKDLSSLSNALNFQEKAAKRHGQGGNFSSVSDEMGLTRSMIDRNKKFQQQYLDNRFVKKDDIDALRSDLEDQAKSFSYKPKSYQKSDELTKAENNVNDLHENGLVSIYGNNNNSAPTNDAPKDATQSFLYDYKENLGKKYNFMSNKDAELQAAAKIILQE